MNLYTLYPVAVDMRDERKMRGYDRFVCNDRWGTCANAHKHPALLIRVPVLFGELVAGDPTMDGIER